MNRKRFLMTLLAVTLIIAMLPGTAFAKKPVTESTNNLSFPAIAVDGFSITPLTAPSFTVPYTGDYPGLTAEEIAWLEANGPWYAQKATGNTWQAEFKIQGNEDVTYIDWSDNMESIYPKVRRSFRLELVLFKELPETEGIFETMTAYTMRALEYPSSSTELQGTNTTTYESTLATVISAKPKLVLQYLGASVPTLEWSSDKWVIPANEEDPEIVPDIVQVGFAPELNVGGKYIYGASSGGWKPSTAGYYRITFYIPSDSGVNLAFATIGNVPTTQVATAVVDSENNLTYMDVLVKAR